MIYVQLFSQERQLKCNYLATKMDQLPGMSQSGWDGTKGNNCTLVCCVGLLFRAAHLWGNSCETRPLRAENGKGRLDGGVGKGAEESRSLTVLAILHSLAWGHFPSSDFHPLLDQAVLKHLVPALLETQGSKFRGNSGILYLSST